MVRGIRPGDVELANYLRDKLLEFDSRYPLPGIHDRDSLECLTIQLVDSVRRVRYVTTIRDSVHLTELCANPYSPAFNPIKAAIWHSRNGNINEAFWLTFLITHFGMNKRTRWDLLKAVYGNMGRELPWTWETVIADPLSFTNWIDENQQELKQYGNFGNHRKYESLKQRITGGAVLSYIDWVGPHHDHLTMIQNLLPIVGSPKENFKLLYRSVSNVYRFGRTGAFDFLTMAGKMKLVDIEPDSTYMHGATGPYTGGCLLFAGDADAYLSKKEVSDCLNELDAFLDIPFGMQVLEDALCNWQKSPNRYIYFNG